MKQIIKMEGIVLKTADYKEQAVIATILTKEGINNYIIKGAKKLSGGTRLLSSLLTKIEFNATCVDGLRALTEGIILNNYLVIKQNINKLFVMYPILEKIIAFGDQVTNKVLFYNFVLQIFSLLEKDLDESTILALFETKLTFLLGINPELRECIICGNIEKKGRFSIYEGGIICDNCLNNNKYDLNINQTESLKLLYFIKLDKINNDFVNLVKNDIFNILKTLDVYYMDHLDFRSKSKQVLNKMK